MHHAYLTEPALSRLDQPFLSNLLNERLEIVNRFMHSDYEVVEALVEQAKGVLEKSSHCSIRTEAAAQIIDFDTWAFSGSQRHLLGHEIDEAIIHSYPLAAAAIYCGIEIFDRCENSPFWSLSDYARAHAIYIRTLRESSQSIRDSYEWSGNGTCNEIHTDMHGDMHYRQVKRAAGVERFGLFPERREDFLASFNRESAPERFGSCYIYQDATPVLLSLLDFAWREGLSRIPEIVEWRAVLKETGEFCANTAEGFGSYGADSEREMFRRQTVFNAAIRNEMSGEFSHGWISISGGPGGRATLPFYQPGELLFLTSGNSEGDFQLPQGLGEFSNRAFHCQIRYGVEDLPQAIRGTLKLFNRDRSIMRRVMQWYNEEKF